MAWKKKKSFKPKRSFKKRYTGKNTAESRMMLYKAIRPELKYTFVNSAGPASANGQLGYLTVLNKGTGSGDRIGDRVRTVYINYDIYCVAPTNGADDSGILTFLVDKAATAAPVYGDIFDITNTRIGQCLKLPQNTDRFVVLKHILCGPVALTHCENNRFRGFIKIPLDLALEQYAPLGTAPTQNALMCAWSSVNNTGLAASSMTFNMSIRTAFVDP